MSGDLNFVGDYPQKTLVRNKALVGIILQTRVLGETGTVTQSPQNPIPNPLGSGRVLGIEKNTLKF
jgi:hypothetical protein